MTDPAKPEDREPMRETQSIMMATMEKVVLTWCAKRYILWYNQGRSYDDGKTVSEW